MVPSLRGVGRTRPAIPWRLGLQPLPGARGLPARPGPWLLWAWHPCLIVGVIDSPGRLLLYFPSPDFSLLTLACLLQNQLVFVFCFYGSINESRA